MQVKFEVDAVLKQVLENLAAMPAWMPAVIRTHMDTLGEIGVDRMREAVADNRYTGDLEESITHRASDGGYTQTIAPEAQRGNYDAGALLEMGTRPHTPPWAPIAAWADFRGLPAFPVWYGIKVSGTAAHPFLDRTLRALEPQITEAAFRIVTTAAALVLRGGGTVSLPGGPAEIPGGVP